MNELIELIKELKVSGDSVIVSIVLALVFFALKGLIKSLIKVLLDTIVEVRSFRNDITEMKVYMAMFPKFQTDLNEYYKRLKKLEDTVQH